MWVCGWGVSRGRVRTKVVAVRGGGSVGGCWVGVGVWCLMVWMDGKFWKVTVFDYAKAHSKHE